MIIDEAVNVMMGEDWGKRENKDLKKIFTKMRTRHLCVFANIPDFWWLDAKYRENMVTFWTHVYQRGWTALSYPSLVPGIKDRWFRDYFLKTQTRISYLTPKDVSEGMMRKYPCYQDIIYYPKVPDKIYSKYRELRDAHTKASGSLQMVGMAPDVLARLAARAIFYQNISRAAYAEEMKPDSLMKLLTKLGLYKKETGGWTEKADKILKIFNMPADELTRTRNMGKRGDRRGYLSDRKKLADNYHENEHGEQAVEEAAPEAAEDNAVSDVVSQAEPPPETISSS